MQGIDRFLNETRVDFRCVMVKTILIVDDNAFVRQALRNIFERESDLAVCGEAENGRDAIQQARQLHPNLIVTFQCL